MVMSRYVWDMRHDSYLMEKDVGETLTALYTNEPSLFGRMISQQRSGGPSYYHVDGQGSTRALTDANEDITDTATYTAFGGEAASTGSTTNPFGYVGSLGYYLNPRSNDLYVRARDYRAEIARWLVLDRSGLIDGPNRYAYARNNPVIRVDPSGASCEVCRVRRFRVPPNTGAIKCKYRNPAPPPRDDLVDHYGGLFEMHAEFEPPSCHCCRYWQTSCARIRFRWQFNTGWTDDRWFTIGDVKCDPNQPATWKREFYGDREIENTVNDEYFQHRKTGCRYRGVDIPGFSFVQGLQNLVNRNNAWILVEVFVKFEGGVEELCPPNAGENEISQRYWFVKCERKFSPSTTPWPTGV